MVKLHNAFDLTNVGKQRVNRGRRQFLQVRDVPSLPKWNKVAINYVAQPKDQFGKHYTKLTYFAVNDKWQMSIGYFRADDMLPIGKMFGLDRIEDTDQLLSKEFHVSIGVKYGNDGNQYLEITDYSLDGTDQPDGQPQSVPIQQDEVPF